jgi:hypothetical protein
MNLLSKLKKSQKTALFGLSMLSLSAFSNLQAQTNLEGQLINKDNDIIPNREVIVRSNNRIIAKTTSNENGYFSFDNLRVEESFESFIGTPSGNLTSNNVELKLNIANDNAHTVAIYNSIGQLVSRQTISQGLGVHNLSIQGIGSAGVYFVSLISNNNISTQKITNLNSSSPNINLTKISSFPVSSGTSPLELTVVGDEFYQDIIQTIIGDSNNLLLIAEDKVDTLETKINLYSNEKKIDGTVTYTFDGLNYQTSRVENGVLNIHEIKPVRYNQIRLIAESEDKFTEDITANLARQININLRNRPREYNFQGQISYQGQQVENALIQILNKDNQIIQSFNVINGEYDFNTILDVDEINFRVLKEGIEKTDVLQLKDNYIKKDIDL